MHEPNPGLPVSGLDELLLRLGGVDHDEVDIPGAAQLERRSGPDGDVVDPDPGLLGEGREQIVQDTAVRRRGRRGQEHPVLWGGGSP